MAITEEPILNRIDRLDNLLRNLEEIRVGNSLNRSSPKSSCASTVSSTYGGGGGDHITTCSSLDGSPRSLEKSCRPIQEVMMEVEHKGNLIERLSFMEDRVLKVWSQLEEEMEAEKKREEVTAEDRKQQQQTSSHEKINSPKKAIKQFVRSCVKSNKGKSKKQK